MEWRRDESGRVWHTSPGPSKALRKLPRSGGGGCSEESPQTLQQGCAPRGRREEEPSQPRAGEHKGARTPLVAPTLGRWSSLEARDAGTEQGARQQEGTNLSSSLDLQLSGCWGLGVPKSPSLGLIRKEVSLEPQATEPSHRMSKAT